MSKQPEAFETWFAASGLGAPHSGNYWAAWAAWQASRAAALEEAIRACDQVDILGADDCIDKILALCKEQS